MEYNFWIQVHRDLPIQQGYFPRCRVCTVHGVRAKPGLQSSFPVDPSIADEPSIADIPPTTSTSITSMLPSSASMDVCVLPDDTNVHPSHNAFVSAEEILPLPKSPHPRTQTRRKHGKTRILTDTPEKLVIERAHKEREKKQEGKKQSNMKDKRKLKKKQNRKKITVSSKFESDVPIPLVDTSEDDTSENERSEPERTELMVGNFIIVKFTTKHRSYHYIGFVENLEGEEVSARFLRRLLV